MAWTLLVGSVAFNAGGVFLLKRRMNDLGAIRISSAAAVWGYGVEMARAPSVWVGLVLFFLAPFLFAVALSRMEITVAYPAQVGLNFLVLYVLAVVSLGESLTVPKVLAALLVLAGVCLLAR